MRIETIETPAKVTITIRLEKGISDKVDELTDKMDLSRQSLIEAILNQALNDKNFVLKVPKRARE